MNINMAELWTTDEVGEWLEENGFEDYIDLFCNKHDIDGQALLMLTEADLKEWPLQLEVLGHIKRLGYCLQKLRKENAENKGRDIENLTQNTQMNDHWRKPYQKVPNKAGRSVSIESDMSVENFGPLCTIFDPEIFKTLLAFIYVFTVFLVTSFIMVIVHDRVPDKSKYPPLPDLILDNVPFMPWAFEACELCGLILATMWIMTLIFHKHRFIILRRMFSLAGTIFLLRCVTMLITSLSVPGIHLECQAQPYRTWAARFERAFEIWSGMGMSLQGVRTCGDYMFSGHTVWLTIFNFFITEYTPRNLVYIHTVTWVLNLFGIFFILAAHEHYSIDVFFAFYITSRLFLYYHTLANNAHVMRHDRKRAKAWFPLFFFFESKVNGAIPNEYEWPFSWPEFLKNAIRKKSVKHASHFD